MNIKLKNLSDEQLESIFKELLKPLAKRCIISSETDEECKRMAKALFKFLDVPIQRELMKIGLEELFEIAFDYEDYYPFVKEELPTLRKLIKYCSRDDKTIHPALKRASEITIEED